MTTKIDVLDHGFVRLVSYMQPVPERIDDVDGDGNPTEIEFFLAQPENWTGDLEIVRNARVSHDADWRTGAEAGKDAGLLRYMYDNQHTSPFEAMVFTFEVKAPIFIFRQWHRHRTWSYNEISARYAELPEEYYTPDLGYMGIQDAKNKQRRLTAEEMKNYPREIEKENEMYCEMNEHCDEAFSTYHSLLHQGCPREMARAVLPLNTYSRMFATVDLHNLIHFLRLRMSPHAQWEIRQYAQALLELIKPVVPVAHALIEADLRGEEEPTPDYSVPINLPKATLPKRDKE